MCAVSALAMVAAIQARRCVRFSASYQANQPETVRWSSDSRPRIPGRTFLPVARAAPTDIGSPVPRSTMSGGRPLLGGKLGVTGIVGLLVLALDAQSRHRMRPVGLQAVFLSAGLAVLPDDVVAGRPVAVHAPLVG